MEKLKIVYDRKIKVKCVSCKKIYTKLSDSMLNHTVDGTECKCDPNFIVLKEYKPIEWTCTDPDNKQYGRQLSETVFEFKENKRSRYCCDEGEIIQRTINLKNYNNEEIKNHVSAYYDSLEELKVMCGNDSNWIIAECIFEQESGLY